MDLKPNKLVGAPPLFFPIACCSADDPQTRDTSLLLCELRLICGGNMKEKHLPEHLPGGGGGGGLHPCNVMDRDSY